MMEIDLLHSYPKLKRDTNQRGASKTKEDQKIAKKYDLDIYKVAQVISALSPRNKWEQNLKDADKVCEAFALGLHPTDIKVCTFHSNKFKAFNILASNTQITNNSLKTFNFVNNIAYLNNDFLTGMLLGGISSILINPFE